MPKKKKNKSSKKKAGKKKAVSAKGRSASGGKKEIIGEKPRRKLIPFTAGKLPSVSKAMPPAATVVPLVSKEVPLVSKPIPLVSAKPGVSIPKYWGMLPSRKWGGSKIPATRKREPIRPKDIGLFKFLGKVVTAPYQPVEMVKGLTAAIGAQAEEERDPRVAAEQELLELKMRREMDEISKKDYEIEETRLKKKIKGLETRKKKPGKKGGKK